MKLLPLGHTWPFPSVNGERTSESLLLEQMPTPPKPTPYEICQLTEPEEALI